MKRSSASFDYANCLPAGNFYENFTIIHKKRRKSSLPLDSINRSGQYARKAEMCPRGKNMAERSLPVSGPGIVSVANRYVCLIFHKTTSRPFDRLTIYFFRSAAMRPFPNKKKIFGHKYDSDKNLNDLLSRPSKYA